MTAASLTECDVAHCHAKYRERLTVCVCVCVCVWQRHYCSYRATLTAMSQRHKSRRCRPQTPVRHMFFQGVYLQRRNATIRGPRQQLFNDTKQTLKLITKNSRTVGGPLPPVGPPSLDAAATPLLRHCVFARNSRVCLCPCVGFVLTSR